MAIGDRSRGGIKWAHNPVNLEYHPLQALPNAPVVRKPSQALAFTAAAAPITLLSPGATVTFSGGTNVVNWFATEPSASLVTFSGGANTYSAPMLSPGATVTFNTGTNVVNWMVTEPSADTVTFGSGTDAANWFVFPSSAGLVTFSGGANGVTYPITIVSPAALATFDTATSIVLEQAVSPGGTVTFSGGTNGAIVPLTVVSPAALVTFSGGSNAVLVPLVLVSPGATITFSGGANGVQYSGQGQIALTALGLALARLGWFPSHLIADSAILAGDVYRDVSDEVRGAHPSGIVGNTQQADKATVAALQLRTDPPNKGTY